MMTGIVTITNVACGNNLEFTMRYTIMKPDQVIIRVQCEHHEINTYHRVQYPNLLFEKVVMMITNDCRNREF